MITSEDARCMKNAYTATINNQRLMSGARMGLVLVLEIPLVEQLALKSKLLEIAHGCPRFSKTVFWKVTHSCGSYA